ncbi:MAG: hypothetical protein WAM60_22190 [Candidatus Promineifilaceae bacterium]
MEKNISASADSPDSEITLHFNLGALRIALSSNSPLVGRYAREFLDEWLEPEAASPPDMQIHLDLSVSLPLFIEHEPIFVNNEQYLPDGVGTLFVFEQPKGFLFYFQDGALVSVKPESRLIEGHITTRLLHYGRLHDLLFTSLSPFLRRRGYYLIHAAAAVREGKAAVFTGPPGCGKSTTVLNLVLNGWQFVSNDTLLLQERPDGIYALPTPGGFSVRPESVSHLPALAAHLPQQQPDQFYHLSPHKLGVKWANPARISTIYFPEISEGKENDLLPLPPAVTMARLIELSLDRWDTADLSAHISFIERLSRQAQGTSLRIADQQKLPNILNNAMRH